MNPKSFDIEIPIVSKKSNIPAVMRNFLNHPIKLSLTNGEILFVLGANGTGKSALMHQIFLNHENSLRIASHRQSSFPKDLFDFSPSRHEFHERHLRLNEEDSRYRYDNYVSDQVIQMPVYRLISSENKRAKEIVRLVDAKYDPQVIYQYALKTPSNISILNDILKTARIPIEIFLQKNNELYAKNIRISGSEYAIAELSDGERNALWIACNVLTADENSMITIDEPERHMHHSTITPFIGALLEKRKDCCFVISTHTVYLPMDFPSASVLLTRGCKWGINKKTNTDEEVQENEVVEWEVDFLMPPGNEIPDDIKKEILGPKEKNLLFVEGANNSLDKQFYELLYEDVTVIPVGSYADVEQRVKAMRKARNENGLHWFNVYGVIDGDGKTEEHKNKLKQNNIIALPCYSVESLYYRTEIIKRMANKYASIFGRNAEDLYQESLSNIAENLGKIKEKLCAMKTAHKIKMFQVSPTWEDVIKNNCNQKPQCDSAEIFTKEKEKFDDLIKCKNWNALIEQYPIKESGVLTNIARPFNVSNKKKTESYEHLLRKLIREDEDGIKAYYKNELLKDLTELIESDSE